MYRSLGEIIFQVHSVETKFGSSEKPLSLQDIDVIDIIGKREDCIMRDIADYLNISVSNVTRLIDNLEKNELVMRKRNHKDRRIINLVLTQKGRGVYQKYLDKVSNLYRLALSAMTEKEQKDFLKLSKKFMEGARAAIKKNSINS